MPTVFTNLEAVALLAGKMSCDVREARRQRIVAAKMPLKPAQNWAWITPPIPSSTPSLTMS
jgi:hypothetical protein